MRFVVTAVSFLVLFTAPAALDDVSDNGGGEHNAGAPEVPAGGSVEGDQVNVYAMDMTVSTDHVASGSAVASAPRCSYTAIAPGVMMEVDGDGDGTMELTTPYRDKETHRFVPRPGPGVEQYTLIRCGDQTSVRWVPPPEAVDRQALVAAAVSRVRAAVPAPSLDISPPPEFGVPAQFGLWLAVDDPGQVNVVAQAGAVWAGATARFQAISWDMGNGDVVDCEGLGSPIVDSDTDEQGPCGYTYRHPADVGVRQITVTGTWSVELVTSFSGPAMLDPATSQRTFDYEVFEIQAVGAPA